MLGRKAHTALAPEEVDWNAVVKSVVEFVEEGGVSEGSPPPPRGRQMAGVGHPDSWPPTNPKPRTPAFEWKVFPLV